MSIVLYSEVKLNRNIKNYNFPSKIEMEKAKEINSKIENILKEESYRGYEISDLTSLEKLKLFEESKITGELLKNEKIASVLLNDSKPVVMVNEKDNIVISKRSNKLELNEIYEEVLSIDNVLDMNLDYSFNDKFGYLTTDPQVCGNALTATVCFHLPATAFFGDESLIRSLNKLGYRVATLESNRVEKLGNIYRVSPDRTIGISEREYLEKLSKITREVEDIENQNRKNLYLDRIIDLEDIVNRAYGTLRYARILEEEEMINKMSGIFLGIELGILKPNRDINLVDTINKFKNGHLQIERGSLLDKKTRDILRANEIRKMMKEVFYV